MKPEECTHPKGRLDYQPAEPDVGITEAFAICQDCGKCLGENELDIVYEPDWDSMRKEE